MACQSVPPSNLSLLGLVRHMTDVERNWFHRVQAGQDAGHADLIRERTDGRVGQ